jgi:hypothetical protein
VVGNLILRQFRDVQAQFYQIVMRADLGLVDVAWEQREEHNNRARMLAEEQNREISALNDEFAEVTEGASPEDAQRLQGRGAGGAQGQGSGGGTTPTPQGASPPEGGATPGGAQGQTQ